MTTTLFDIYDKASFDQEIRLIGSTKSWKTDLEISKWNFQGVESLWTMLTRVGRRIMNFGVKNVNLTFRVWSFQSQFLFISHKKKKDNSSSCESFFLISMNFSFYLLRKSVFGSWGTGREIKAAKCSGAATRKPIQKSTSTKESSKGKINVEKRVDKCSYYIQRKMIFC